VGLEDTQMKKNHEMKKCQAMWGQAMNKRKGGICFREGSPLRQEGGHEIDQAIWKKGEA